ncbi:hypothetical protein DPMN_090448 [Dreissena polymorpha]|uniref:MD-2-related lipid-recognition domain-containing protein n=2 Tax=Dreissena polymorpha TaxID=45954 RepID=A0A9D4QYB7_DREPO|nr:hypothetical protein DPMN_090448 [Dreissena polymorpha]
MYKNCGPDSIKYISMDPCEIEPCVFTKGENVSVTIDFTTNSTVTDVQAKVYGEVAGVFVPFALPNPDGCQGCDLTCPLGAGEQSYTNTFPVLAIYPEIKVVVKWELLDQDSNTLVCFEFPMQITESAGNIY